MPKDQRTTDEPMGTLSLYQLDARYQALEMALIQSGGELTVGIEAEYDDLLEATEAKATNYIRMIRKFEASAVGVDLEVKRLAAAKQTFANAAKRLKNRLRDSMVLRGEKKFETPIGRINLQNAGGKVSVVMFDGVTVEQLPDRFIRVTREPDLDAIRTALEAEVQFVDEDLDAGRFARFAERTKIVRIY